MSYGVERKDSSFSMNLKILFANPQPKNYGLFVETLTEKQAQGIKPQAASNAVSYWIKK